MRVAVTLEHRFAQSSDGAVWSRTMFPYQFWMRYLDVFDNVTILARAEPVSEPPVDWHRVDGPRVRFTAVPYYVGPMGFLRCLSRIRRAGRAAVGPEDAVIFRVSSPIASAIQPMLALRGQPYAVEVVCDPHDVFSPRAVHHPLRVFFRKWFTSELRKVCSSAAAAAYVTREALQRRYPTHPDCVSTSYSSTELPDEAFAPHPRCAKPFARSLKVVAVGSLAQMYKGIDVLIDAIALCHREEMPFTLTIIGDGKHRTQLEQQAHGLGLSEAVTFAGQVPAGQAVREQLDCADLFVLPSRTEGLPRALLEAMARGLPCIGTTVGGVPELLEPDAMVPPDDSDSLARKLLEVAANPQCRQKMANRNHSVAKQYHDDLMNSRRREFYQHIRQVTQQRLGRKFA